MKNAPKTQPHYYRRALAAGFLVPPRVADDVLRKLPHPPKPERPARLVEAVIDERRKER